MCLPSQKTSNGSARLFVRLRRLGTVGIFPFRSTSDPRENIASWYHSFPFFATFFHEKIDIPRLRWYDDGNFTGVKCPWERRQLLRENSEPGGNPGRYRHCMRGEAAQDESRPLDFFREGCGAFRMRKSGDLLSLSPTPQVRICRALTRKYGCGSFWAAAFFAALPPGGFPHFRRQRSGQLHGICRVIINF